MKRYSALHKIMIMIGLSLVGSYCMGSVNYQEQLKQSADKVINYSSHLVKSIGSYSRQLWSDLKYYFSQEQETVVIQQLSPEQEAFYRDSNKCLPGPGLEDCLNNEEFFSENYFAYGDKNIAPFLNNDYSSDPIE